MTKSQSAETSTIRHPELDGVARITHVPFLGARGHQPVLGRDSSRGADRSPCVTGTSARTATLIARGQLGIGDTLVHESITGEMCRAVPYGQVKAVAFDGVRNNLTGSAFVTGTAEWLVDSRDPLRDGFLVLG